jgi:hypothetical protein
MIESWDDPTRQTPQPRPLPMHQMVSTPLDTSRRCWVLAIVVAVQFMFGVDAFIVNVAIPTIAIELHTSWRRSRP